MRGLKAVLVVIGVACVLGGIPGLLAPWSSIVRWLGFIGYAAPPADPLVRYCLRLASLGLVLAGVFFLVLASDPLRSRPMLALAVWGLFLVGAVALVSGWLIQLHPPWYLADAGSCLLGAVLILAFWPRTPAHASGEGLR